MIRGVQKEMIMVKTDKNSIFEVVYFLLRSDIAEPKPSENDILKEADKIIEENCSHKKRRRNERKKKLRSGIPFFIFGSISGILSTALLCLFFTMK